MKKNVLIVFVKNIKLGKVKTRLAKTIGNKAAFEIYKALVKITEKATKDIPVATHIYFSDTIVHTKWQDKFKTVQKGNDLGERMKNAFEDGFKKGYKNIILIGSDLPEISSKTILQGFTSLSRTDTVFGKAADGGYYLIGLSKMNAPIFENKPWSTTQLLDVTLQELQNNHQTVSLLPTLNDIDTFEDLIASDFYKKNIYIQKLCTIR